MGGRPCHDTSEAQSWLMWQPQASQPASQQASAKRLLLGNMDACIQPSLLAFIAASCGCWKLCSGLYIEYLKTWPTLHLC